MHNENNDYQWDIDDDKVTDVTFGTSANYAYDLYKEKVAQIAALKYECKLLVDNYHSEMRHSHIPPQFRQDIIEDMFSEDKKTVKFAREQFLRKGFSPDFPKNHKIEFVNYSRHGYHTTAIGVVLCIGDYEYTMEFPQPANIRDEKDKESLMGDVKFRVDRIHKSKKDEFIREMESVQMPTYDWKKCFEAIEANVAQNAAK